MFYTFDSNNPKTEKQMEKFSASDIQTIQNATSGNVAPVQQQVVDNTPAPDPAPTNTDPVVNNAPAADPTPSAFDIQKYGYKSHEELDGALSRIPTLERELKQLNEHKAGPQFKSDRHKFLYEVGERSEGMELSAVRQLLDVVELLDRKDAPDQQIRFEAFRLKPENKGLSQEEISALFKAEEVERFGNPLDTENPQTEIQKIRAKQATASAKEVLGKIKSDWESTRPVQKTPEDLARENAEYRQFLQKNLTGFDGIPSIKLQATDEKGEKLEGNINFKIDAQNQLPVVMEAIADPQGWWDSKLESLGIMAPGQEVPDFKKFADFVTRIEYMNDLLNQSYQQGLADQLSNKLKTARNVSDPNNSTGSQAPVKVLDEKADAARSAMKVAGLI